MHGGRKLEIEISGVNHQGGQGTQGAVAMQMK